MYKIVICFALFFSNALVAQTIPEARKIDWSIAGLTNYNEPALFINMSTEGADNTGQTANDALLTTVLNSIPAAGAIIYFPNGEYLFNQRIVLKSNIVIRGESADNTILKFNLGGVNNCFHIEGVQTAFETQVTNDLVKGQSVFNVVDAGNFVIGGFAILSEDDSDKVTSSWALRTSGQVVEIANIVGNQITIKNPLRRNYLVTAGPKLTRINPIKNIGIENVTIHRLDATTNQTSNITINRGSNIKISCVKSFNSNFAHIAINNATNVVVEGSYFQDGFSYGNGGKAYGVVLQNTTGESLIYNNIFSHLRHSILLQSGSNGNVISYNFSRDPYWTDVALPANSAGDIVLHGNYPYLNLFEGNIVQNIVIDNSHGINGPHNTFHRNRAELYGIFMNSSPASNNQNFSSNEITNTGFLLGNYTLSGSGHYQYNNNKNGIILPSGTNLVTPYSYYRSSSLSFYDTNSSWPPIGNVANYNTFLNESRIRYANSQLTRCSTNETLDLDDIYYTNRILFYPNPAKDFLKIESPIRIIQVQIITMDGKLVLNKHFNLENQFSIDVSYLPNDVYLVKLIFDNSNTVVKKLIKLN
jgi:hypothetical protein